MLTAELWGILSGLQVAWMHGIKRIWVESDSLTAVSLIKFGCSQFKNYAGLVNYIKELIGNGKSTSVITTGRVIELQTFLLPL